jgi:hypothetical protein
MAVAESSPRAHEPQPPCGAAGAAARANVGTIGNGPFDTFSDFPLSDR